eukprot:TRINITY_DN50928_c0_g1_i1.p1 TRINITY_DN50928_c0_g1~~TRINITY_DN50928_c0_g1_i1.p1  ORF type:complete len:296 (+),score=41.64 TRINITY_DN50928_c0_g1_i1:62-889(+)
MALLVVLTFFTLLSLCVHGHFLWLRESSATESAVVTFGERAGVPESSEMLALVANLTSVYLQRADNDRGQVPMSTIKLPGGMAELRSDIPLPAQAPYSLELSATFGVFAEGPEPPRLLKYWANADRVNVGDEWPLVEEWSGKDGLEIILLSGSLQGQPRSEAQCSEPGIVAGGSVACVMSMVRYRKATLEGANITTFAGNGSKIGTAVSGKSGFTLLAYPLSSTRELEFTEVFASANYHEQGSGSYSGKSYEFTDHWATTYSRLPLAAPSATFVV